MKILDAFRDFPGGEKEVKPKRKPATTARVHKLPNKTEENKARGAIAFGITAADYLFGTFFSGAPTFNAETGEMVFDQQGRPITEGGIWQPQDRLDKDEIGLLAEAIYGEVAQRPTLVIQLARIASTKGAHARLLQACALVALPRLARRGILPEEMANQLSLVLMLAPIEDDGTLDNDDGSGDGETRPNSNAGAVESGPASGSDWADRAGKIDRDRMAAEAAPVRAGAEEQAGRHRVRRNQAGEGSSFLEEPTPMAVGAGTDVLKAGNGVRESV